MTRRVRCHEDIGGMGSENQRLEATPLRTSAWDFRCCTKGTYERSSKLLKGGLDRG